MTTETITDYGTLEGSKQALVKDLKSVANDADALISNVAAATKEEINLARTKLAARLAETKTRFVDAGVAVSEKARGTVNATDGYVRENPWKVLGVVAAAGLIIGALISRRPLNDG